MTTPTWPVWQLSPPTEGFTHSDHFQPGSKTILEAFTLPNFTTSTLAFGVILLNLHY